MGVVAEIADDVLVMYHGKVMETRRCRNHLPRAAGRLHPHADRLGDQAAEAKSDLRAARPPLPADLPPVLSVRDLSMRFARGAGGRQGVASTSAPARRWASSANRARARPPWAAASSASTTPTAAPSTTASPTAASSTWCTADGPALKDMRREVRMIFQDPFGSLNPRMTVAQIIGEPLLVNGIAHGRELDDEVSRADGAGRAGTRLARALPARLLGRPAPAHRHRPRHRAEAAGHRGRRGHLARSTSRCGSRCST